MNKLKYIDLALHSLEDKTDVEEILLSQIHSLPYLNFIDNKIERKAIKYCGTDKRFEKNGIKYEFIKGKNKKWNMHLGLFYKLKKHKLNEGYEIWIYSEMPRNICFHNGKVTSENVPVYQLVNIDLSVVDLKASEIQLLTEKIIIECWTNEDPTTVL